MQKSKYNIFLQIDKKANELEAFGESRHQAKQELKREVRAKGEVYSATMATEKIHSITTMDNYKQVLNQFCTWGVKNKVFSPMAELKEAIQTHGVDYLKYREETCAAASVKRDRAALGKFAGEQIQYTIEKPMERNRSRNATQMDKHFSEDKNKELITIAKATGGRRDDIARMKAEDFYKDAQGNLWVHIEKSKGGRDRESIVLPQYQKEVEQLIAQKEGKLFERVHSKADIHAYRHEYARELFHLAETDKGYRDDILGAYKPRDERDIKNHDVYHGRGENKGFSCDRDSLYLVSQSLGHTRLEVTLNSYINT